MPAKNKSVFLSAAPQLKKIPPERQKAQKNIVIQEETF